jgi:hypothetical protein
MQAFDASSMIYAWDNYPLQQFPGLWEWLAREINEQRLLMPSVAFDEVCNKAPECGTWLRASGLGLLAISNAILQDALRIKALLGIVDDNYHAKGVGENDLLIISTARAHGRELVSNESKQNNLPQEIRRCKIPAVCSMRDVAVPCVDFVEYIKRSSAVFR